MLRGFGVWYAAMKLSTSLLLPLILLAGCGSSDSGGAEPVVPPCSDPGATPLAGIWHLRLTFDGSVTTSRSMRIDETADGYRVVFLGNETTTHSYEGSVVSILWSEDRDDGTTRTRELRMEQVDCASTVTGIYEGCTLGMDANGQPTRECVPATVEGAKVEPLDEPVADKMTLLAEYGGSPSTGPWAQDGDITVNVRVRDNIAYLAHFDGLRIVDFSDMSNPRERGFLPFPSMNSSDYFNDVKIVDGPDSTVYALMASDDLGVLVVNITDPDNPIEVTAFPDPDLTPGDEVPGVHTLFVEGTRAYLAFTGAGSLLIFDITNPAEPQHIGGYTHPRLEEAGGYLHDLYVKDGRAYLNYWNLGMTIIDTMEDPQNPTLVGEYVNYGGNTSHSNWVTRVGDRTISVHGDEEYGAHARIVDVDPNSETFLATLSEYQTRPQVSIHNILVHENLAFVTYYQDGLRVLDVSDPANPVKIAHYHSWPGPEPGYGYSFYEGAIGVDYDPATGLIYLADTHRGILVLTLDP